ncbi:MAG: rRNA maturation RNase YbeY [Lachnospiraceae bacterium]|nr:rRNA maturation RNase YbeY [Lachnospiraceae bacterium]
MTLYFDASEGINLPDFSCEELFNAVAERVLSMEGCPFECEISLSLVSPERIKELNRNFRGIDKVTDVLSFPFQEFETPGVFKDIDESSFNPENKELMLGDIVICQEKAVSQAEEYGHSLKREFAFLIAHSMLHLLGFDHEEKEDERLMTEKQEEALSSLGIER